MPKKKRASNQQTSVKVGNISDISREVNVAGENITTHDGSTDLSAAESRQYSTSSMSESNPALKHLQLIKKI